MMLESLLSRPRLLPLWPTSLVSVPATLTYLESQARSNRKLAIGVLLSILFHALLMWSIRQPVQNNSEAGSSAPKTMVVHLNQPTVPPSAAQAEPPAVHVEPKPVAPPRPRPSIMTVPKLNAQNPVPLEPPVPPAPARKFDPPSPTDFSSMLEARRAQRRAAEEALAQSNAAARSAERQPTADESSSAALNRNLQTLGGGNGGTGGVFRILFKGHRYGQFAFNGWQPRASGGWREVIEVDAGQDGNVDLAIVRRMIDLIRKYYQGDFNWESNRLGRVIVLSARKEDSAGLEAFLMREFFN